MLHSVRHLEFFVGRGGIDGLGDPAWTERLPVKVGGIPVELTKSNDSSLDGY